MSLHHPFLLIASLAAIATTPSHAQAGPSPSVAEVNGALIVSDGGKDLASFVPRTEKGRRGPAVLRSHSVTGHAVVEVRIPILGEGPRREEVWIAELAGDKAKEIWWDQVGPQDADGETSLVVSVSSQGIESYQSAARISRCDGAQVALFRRVWDFASHGFHAAAPALPPRSPSTVQARRGDSSMPAGKPLGGFFFNAASSSSSVGKAARVLPPVAVNDGNPATIWSSGGEGQGQLLTARSSGGFAITGLRILPGDTRDESAFRQSARPRKLTLVFDREPAHNLDVDLLEDGDGGARRFRQPFGIALPKPVASACVTVVVRDVTPAKAALAIADIDVLTELDGPQAVDRLVDSLAQGTSCEARQPLLVRSEGTPALAKVASEISRLAPGAGRTCLVEALAALLAAGAPATPETSTALVAALKQTTPAEERTVMKLLAGLPVLPVDAVAAILLDDKQSDGDRQRAARVLAATKDPLAQAKLLAAVGRGSTELRKALRSIVSGLRAPIAANALAALGATPTTDKDRRADFLVILGALATAEPDSRAAIVAALRAPLHDAVSFEERVRAIQGLGLVHDAASIDELVALRAHDSDGVLRSLATGELIGAEGQTVVAALRAALADADPRVRETAAAGLGQKRDKDAAKQLIAGAEQEPWPLVRRAEIQALGQLCVAEGNELLVRALQRDVEDVRQAALVGLAHCYGARATPLLLRVLGRQPESADMRALAARLIAERTDPKKDAQKDAKVIHDLVEALSRLVVESQADLSLEGVIANAAMALASIGGPDAIAALISLLSDPRPSVQRMAVDALGFACDPGAGAIALRGAARRQDVSVAIPAAAAAHHCLERR